MTVSHVWRKHKARPVPLQDDPSYRRYSGFCADCTGRVLARWVRGTVHFVHAPGERFRAEMREAYER